MRARRRTEGGQVPPLHTTPSATPSLNDPVGEGLGYVVAAVILVGGGMLAPSLFLNWFVGPTVVVVSVAALAPLSRRRRS